MDPRKAALCQGLPALVQRARRTGARGAVTEEELRAAVRRLVDDGLLGGPRVEEDELPLLLQLTAAGPSLC